MRLRYGSVTRDVSLPSHTLDAAAIRRAAGACLKRVDLTRRLRLLGVEVQQLAAELWPKLSTGQTAQELLAKLGVKPDFSATAKLRCIHRTIGEAEVYFVANPERHDVPSRVAQSPTANAGS